MISGVAHEFISTVWPHYGQHGNVRYVNIVIYGKSACNFSHSPILLEEEVRMKLQLE